MVKRGDMVVTGASELGEGAYQLNTYRKVPAVRFTTPINNGFEIQSKNTVSRR
jgi:hypothetical protein